MRIRLHGAPAEITETLTALRQTLTIYTESRPFPHRPPSHPTRVYLDAIVRLTREESQ